MHHSNCIAVLVFAWAASPCWGIWWSDPTDDTLEPASSSTLDATGISVTSDGTFLTVALEFNPAIHTSDDLELLFGWVDFDVDLDSSTGRTSHIDEYTLSPSLELGVDYHVGLTAYTAEFYYTENQVDTWIGDYNVNINGLTVSVDLPISSSSPSDGIQISGNYALSFLIGNSDIGLTDRGPNGDTPFISPEPDGCLLFLCLAVGIDTMVTRRRKKWGTEKR